MKIKLEELEAARLQTMVERVRTMGAQVELAQARHGMAQAQVAAELARLTGGKPEAVSGRSFQVGQDFLEIDLPDQPKMEPEQLKRVPSVPEKGCR